MQVGLVCAAALAAVHVAGSSLASVSSSQMITTAPEVTIRVVDAGPKTAALTIVFVPGWRFSADIWRVQLTAFSAKYRVVAMDPRSQGASSKVLSGNTAEDRAADLRAILDVLHAGPTVLVGWSQGAQDVAAYVDNYGTGGLRGLVFVDAAPAQGWEKAVAASGAAQQLKNISLYARYPKEATEGMMQAVFKTPRPAAEQAHLVAEALKTPPTLGAAMLEDDLFGPDRMSSLAKADIPSLLIAADTSSNAEDLAALAKVLPRAKPVQNVPGAGHAVFVDRPEAFNRLLEGFLTTLPK